MTLDVNWERVKQEAFTKIRINFPVETLIRLKGVGNYTPVSGDAIAEYKWVKKWRDAHHR